MEQSHLITIENLIGAIANTILKLNKIKEGKQVNYDTEFITKLIDFFDEANKENYHELLYDKYFIVSEETLGSLHQEFKANKISEKVDFEKIKKSLLEITKGSQEQNIEDSMTKLKDIALILLQVKNQRSISV